MAFRMKAMGLTVACAALAPMASYATDGTITFNGTISSQTCTISGNGQGNNFTVTLPNVSTSALSATGNTAGRTPFNIALTNCSPDSGHVQTYFEPGATVDTATGQLLNVNGVATHVEVGLLNSDASPIRLGAAQASQNSQLVAIASGAATLDYYAQYVAVGGAATPGSVSTSVLYSMSYQ